MTTETLAPPAPDLDQGAPSPAIPPLAGRKGRDTVAGEIKARRVHRKKDAPQVEDQPTNFTDAQAKPIASMLVAGLLKPLCGGMATKLDTEAKALAPDFTFALTDPEATVLEGMTIEALKTLPYNQVARWAPWLALTVTASGFAFARVMMVREIKAARKKGVGDAPANKG